MKVESVLFIFSFLYFLSPVALVPYLLVTFSHITILTESSGASAAADAAAAAAISGIEEEDEGGGVDLRTLRAIRVLRPLKLVSGVPSKCLQLLNFHQSKNNFYFWFTIAAL